MKRTLTLLAATAAFAPVLTAGTAHAAPSATITVSPKTAVLVAKKSTTVTFKVKIPGLPAGSEVDITARGPKGDANWAYAKDPDGDGIYVGTARFSRTDEAGKWNVETEILNGDTYDYEPGPSTSFWLKWSTRLTANAGPEPVRKGKAITVTGRLTRLTQYGFPADYAGLKGQRVRILFKRKGTKKWVVKGSVTTGANGRYTKRFKAQHDGYWCVQYQGSARFAPVLSNGDYVDVR